MASVRPCGRRAVRLARSARPVHALDGAVGRLAVAHPPAAPDGQRPGLFERAPRARRRRSAVARQPGRRTAGAPRHLSFTAGRRKLAWNANVVSLGLSTGFIEPLESTSIHLVQSGIQKLLALFPDRRFNPAERDEYNRQVQDVFEDVRDFIILHYKVTRRDDSEFWNYCRTMDLPDSLASKLELWRSKGRLFRDGQELFGPPSWVAVLLGQGIVPEEQDPAVMTIDRATAAETLEKMHLSYRRMAEHMPAHADFVAQACAAATPA